MNEIKRNPVIGVLLIMDTTIPVFYVEVPITYEYIDSLLTAAFEGGINYWAEIPEVTSRNGKEVKLNKSSLDACCWYADYQQNWEYRLIDVETGKPFEEGETVVYVGPFCDEHGRALQGTGKYRHLNAETLREGLCLFISSQWSSENSIPGVLDVDAEIADAIIQCSVFGGLVYG